MPVLIGCHSLLIEISEAFKLKRAAMIHIYDSCLSGLAYLVLGNLGEVNGKKN